MADTTKILAIAVVAVIAIGGISAYLLIGDDDEVVKNYSGRLQIFGNADNDDHIDSDDLKAFDEMYESNSWDKTKNPYADANRNGVLDDGDREIIQKLVNKESCKVSYINGLGDVATVEYPLKKIAIAGTSIHPVINALGAADLAKAKAGGTKSLNPVLDEPTFDLPSIGSSPYKIDKELMSNYDIDAVITLYSSTYDQVETALAGTPVQCVRIDPESTDSSLNTYLLMGFLLQKTERADVIVGFYDKYNKIIADKVAKIEDKKTSITMYSFSMCGTKYYLTENSVSAGTINLSDFEKNTQSMKDDMGAWAAVPKYQADYIIQYEGMSLRNDDAANKVDKYTAYGQYAAKMDAYPEHYFVVNKNMHDIARIAFTAGVIYEEEFGLDFAYDLYQELIEVFYPYVTDYDVRVDTTCVVTYDMVKDQIKI